MKIEIIRETLKNKSLKKEFALITNLINGESEIFFPGYNLSGMFLNYSEEIFDLALEEYLEEGNLIIEWPEIAKKYLPEPDLKIKIEIDKFSEKRNLIIYSQEPIKI